MFFGNFDNVVTYQCHISEVGHFHFVNGSNERLCLCGQANKEQGLFLELINGTCYLL